MSAARDRFKRIQGLDALRMEGLRAEKTLEAIEEQLAVQQERYTRDLIALTRREGAVHEASVWKMVALADIASRLRHDAESGEVAAAKLADLNREAGGG